MTTTIKDRETGETYSGKTAATIVRREWGRQVLVLWEHSSDFEPTYRIGAVVEPAPTGGWIVITTVHEGI